MKTLKGIEKINHILNDFLEPFECEVEVGPDFAYYYGSSTIMYSFVVSERMDRLFMGFAKSIGLKADIDIFLLSFMHEWGHHMTLEDLSDGEYKYSQDIKETLSSSDADCDIYFNLPDELAATTYAIDYINSHEKELKLWWETKLQPAIIEFYKLNEVI